MLLLQQVVNGLVLGTTYSLIALGFTLVLGVLGQLNMAIGETLMVSGFIGLVLMTSTEIPFAVALAGAAAAGALISLATYVIWFTIVRQTYYTASILSTIGVGILLTAGAATVYGSEARSFPKAVPERVYEEGGVGISLAQILVLSIAVAVMIALHLIVNRTRLGLALHAVSNDQAPHRCSGCRCAAS